MSAHPRTDRRPHHHQRHLAPHRQEWIPRGSPAPPLLPTPGPGIGHGHEPAPVHHNHHRHHQPNPNPNPNSNPKPNRHRPAPPPSHPLEDPKSSSSSASAEVPQLVQEIEEKLSRGVVECMICYDMVRRSNPVWSCSSCFSIFHLHCIRKWSRSPTSAADANSSSNWRCPGCQSVQSVQSKDLAYTCFCGARRDPPSDFYLTPHSCGESCSKPLDRPGGRDQDSDPDLRCPHVCVLQCHPGPCPPCKAFAPRRPCPCGKKTIVRRCSDRTGPITCGQRCDRLLSCHRHRCDRQCHTGPCSPCRVPVAASCFCKKRTEVILCGDMAFSGELDEIDGGVFSCNSQCGKMLSCGNHWCAETCHPGPCGECDLVPEKVKKCCCGKTELVEERKSCLDAIPTCSATCDKLLPCGIHRCKGTCHEGACPPCLVRVDQKCRCGSSLRMVECYVSTEERDKFVCDKPCGRKKNCGRHRCSERCCPLSKPGSVQSADSDWDPHFCSVPCGKRLRCGQHSCQLLCHSGHCPPCLETIFSDLCCACGKTFIPPPLPCGTPAPSCPHPCLVPQPCGHSSSHTCHFGDCPPCSVPVAKECIGGHVLLRNIPCGSKDIRCNQLCGKTRQCGMHACTRTCHPPPCDPPLASALDPGVKSSCGQVCGAPRRDCKHTCTASCHPSSLCPEMRCEFPVAIACSCGRITATVPCGAGGSTSSFNVDAVFEASVVQKLPAPLQPVEGSGKKVPLGQRKLTCDEECEKLARKRQLAEAFDITNPNLDFLHFGENSAASESMGDLFRREPKWVLAVEERCKFLVLGKAKGATATGLRVHVFCAALKEKRDAIWQIAERWKLSVQAAGWEPKRFLIVHVTPKSKPPARILGSKPGVPVIAPHPPAFDPLIDMEPRLVVAMLDLPRDADISALVLRFGGECELVWLNDKNALAVFSDPARASTALRRLDHGSAYQGAVVVIQNGGPSGCSSNAWGGGGAKEGGSAPVKSGNPWKKALASESDSWGGEWSSTADAVVPVWRGNEAPPLSTSVNRWNILDPDTKAEPVASGSTVEQDAANNSEQGDASVVESGTAVDDWEDACD